MATDNSRPLLEFLKPDAVIYINGIPFEWNYFKIVNNNVSRADTLEAHLNLYGWDPPYLDKFFTAHEYKAEVLVRLGRDLPYHRIFWGYLDDLEEDPEEGNIIVTGRDFSALLLDAQTTIKFEGLTSSEIAVTLAKEHGLKYIVTPTYGDVGTVYQNQIVKLTSTQNEWTLLTFLADLDGFDLYIKDDTLYYVSRDKRGRPYYDIVWIDPKLRQQDNSPFSNVIDIKFFRTFTIAKDIRVHVKSFSITDNKVHSAIGEKHRSIGTASGRKQIYNILGPNQSQEETTQFAQQVARDISQHELRLEARLIADERLEKDSVIQVKGKSAIFDTIYYVDSITRTFTTGADGGYWLEVIAKNHPTANEYTTL